VDDSNWKECERPLPSSGGPEKTIAYVGECSPGTGADSWTLHTSSTGLQGHNCTSTAPRHLSTATAADSSTHSMDIMHHGRYLQHFPLLYLNKAAPHRLVVRACLLFVQNSLQHVYFQNLTLSSYHQKLCL